MDIDSIAYRNAYNFSKELLKLKNKVQEYEYKLEGKEDTNDIESQSGNVCRIHVHTRIFDWKQPPNKNNGSSGTGTGFVLRDISSEDDTIYILTAHHVISNAIQIRIKFTKISSDDLDGKIIGCNPAMDVALLAVNNIGLKNKIKGFEIGNADEISPLEEVRAMGFALGKEHLQTTQGVISGRISKPSRLQTNCDVNPGNSGGPLLNSENKVLGIVTSGLTNANGIYYAAPINEAIIMVERMLKGNLYIQKPLTAHGAVFDQIPNINCMFTKSNKVLLENLPSHEDQCKYGIYCTSVHHTVEFPQTIDDAINNLKKKSGDELLEAIEFLKSVTIFGEMTKCKWKILLLKKFNMKTVHNLLHILRNETLEKGDIVCSMTINGTLYNIDIQMNCQFDFWGDRLPYYSIFDRMKIGEQVLFQIWRPKNDTFEKKHVNITLREQKDVFREMYADTENIPYLSLAGVFVMPLLHNHIPLFKNNSMINMMNTPTAPNKSQLLITHILPESPFNNSESISAGDMIVSINDKKVDSLNTLSRYWNNIISKNMPVTLHMRDGSLTTSTYSSIKEAEEKIIQEYKSKDFVKKFI
tara:strand:+ start:125 stop:1876 length:1752 start_codon:yes stop_codon:yes gene_type:complete